MFISTIYGTVMLIKKVLAAFLYFIWVLWSRVKNKSMFLTIVLSLQVESTIEYISRHEAPGAILVFLTGWDDISKLLDKVKGNRFLGDPSKFMVLPLHGSMPTINQREIFDRPPPNKRQAYFIYVKKFHQFMDVRVIILISYVCIHVYDLCDPSYHFFPICV